MNLTQMILEVKRMRDARKNGDFSERDKARSLRRILKMEQRKNAARVRVARDEVKRIRRVAHLAERGLLTPTGRAVGISLIYHRPTNDIPVDRHAALIIPGKAPKGIL